MISTRAGAGVVLEELAQASMLDDSMSMARSTVMTIGYQGRTLDQLVADLVSAGVRQVVDVRALPLSRRKGFSKTPLRTALEAQGIGYVHLRSAGNPFRAQDASAADILAQYREHLEGAPDIVAEVADAAMAMPSALLCMERHAHECHRSVIAQQLANTKRVAVKHL